MKKLEDFWTGAERFSSEGKGDKGARVKSDERSHAPSHNREHEGKVEEKNGEWLRGSERARPGAEVAGLLASQSRAFLPRPRFRVAHFSPF